MIKIAERPFDFLNNAIGTQVLVDLKGGKEVRGKLEAFDQHMNLALSDATELENGEKTQKMGRVILRGDNIFYIST